MKKIITLLLLCSGVAIIFAGCGSAERSQRAQSLNNLKAIGIGMMMYANDHAEYFPAPPARAKDGSVNLTAGLEMLLNGYLIELTNYIMPYDQIGSVATSAEAFDQVENCSYAYLGHRAVSGKTSSAFPLAMEKPWRLPANFEQIAVLFTDGSVRAIDCPGVSKKSCREVVEFIISNHGSALKESEKELLRSNADLADKLR